MKMKHPAADLAFAVLAVLAPAAALALATPETSRLFVKRVDPQSGVTSYMLRPGIAAENQQSLYFVIKSMTDDGRFLFFWKSDNEFKAKGPVRRRLAMVDFEKDEVVDPGLGNVMPFVDAAKDLIYFVAHGGPNGKAGISVLDLKADPLQPRQLCEMPQALTGLGRVNNYCTHLTLTRDRSKAFLDSSIATSNGTRYVQGTVTLATGEYESWGETYFHCNHGQLCPADDDLALCAWEGSWLEQGREFERKTGFSPRMWFIHSDGRHEFVPAYRSNKEPTHETWASDGKGHYWCSKPMGVFYQDRKTGHQWNVCPHYAEHASMSDDGRFVVFDQKPKGWWRGSAQRVGFWNRAAGRHVWVYSTSASLCGVKRQSTLHPDAHPHFGGGGRYVISTIDCADGHMDLLVTPVAELVARTSEPSEAAKAFAEWPKGKGPLEVGRKLVELFVSRSPEEWVAKHIGPARAKTTVSYPTVCTWYGALAFVTENGDRVERTRLVSRLAGAYNPFFTKWKDRIPPCDHVDNNMFGCLPLALYPFTGDKRLLDEGLRMADAQWREPLESDPVINGMLPFAERHALWEKGYTGQTRFWMDDMFMITIIQLQAYLATGERKYAERASKEMVLYLDKMQNPDGLFHHGPGAPFVWGRGNGWMAAGMAMLLKNLPLDDANAPRIKDGFRKMMAALLKHQRPDGMWGQLVDDPDIWPETSGSAMFAYAFIEGVSHGWLDAGSYAPAARKAFLALTNYLEPDGSMRDVCCGTNVGSNREHYVKRPRITGDLHGQAPMLWCCAALADYAQP